LEVVDRGSLDPVEDVMQVLNVTGVPVYRVGVFPEGGAVQTYSGRGDVTGALS